MPELTPIQGSPDIPGKFQISFKNNKFNITLPDGTQRSVEAIKEKGKFPLDKGKPLLGKEIDTAQGILEKTFSKTGMQEKAKNLKADKIVDPVNDIQIFFSDTVKSKDLPKPPPLPSPKPKLP